MSDLIDRQKAIEKIYWLGLDNYTAIMCDIAIRALPPVEPIRPRGHWIEPQQDDGMSDPIKYQVRCSNCGWDIDPQTWYEEMAHNYCPNCGADMRESEGEK